MNVGAGLRDGNRERFIMVGVDGEQQVCVCATLIQCPYVVGKDGRVGLEICAVMVERSQDINVGCQRKDYYEGQENVEIASNVVKYRRHSSVDSSPCFRPTAQESLK